MPKITDLPEIQSDSIADNDVVPIIDVSEGSSGSKKSRLSSIAEWVLGTFNGLSIGGKTQTVKAAIDAVNNAFVSGFITATQNSVDGLWKNGLYFVGNSPSGKPLGTTGANTGGVCIVIGMNIENQTAQNIVRIFIYTNQTLHPGIYIQAYSGPYGGTWNHISLDT